MIGKTESERWVVSLAASESETIIAIPRLISSQNHSLRSSENLLYLGILCHLYYLLMRVVGILQKRLGTNYSKLAASLDMSFGLLISSDLPKLLSKLSLILSTLLFPGLFTGCFVTLFSVYAILAHLCGLFSATSEASCMETIYPVFRWKASCM
ncbi:Phosphate transporter PHO1 [Camellia lanceoleosa]|nr:Phosphate transporter PHO1 [Camellia lanceoleosa]